MKKNEKIRTPLGIISVFKNEIPERYHCAAGPEILRISETHIRIRTIDQAVSWGEEVYSDHYGMKRWIIGEKLPEIQDWNLKLKKLRCNPCRNCGRC